MIVTETRTPSLTMMMIVLKHRVLLPKTAMAVSTVTAMAGRTGEMLSQKKELNGLTKTKMDMVTIPMVSMETNVRLHGVIHSRTDMVAPIETMTVGLTQMIGASGGLFGPLQMVQMLQNLLQMGNALVSSLVESHTRQAHHPCACQKISLSLSHLLSHLLCQERRIWPVWLSSHLQAPQPPQRALPVCAARGRWWPSGSRRKSPRRAPGAIARSRAARPPGSGRQKRRRL